MLDTGLWMSDPKCVEVYGMLKAVAPTVLPMLIGLL